MADRGRKACPVGSPLIDEWWQDHCQKLHKQRLQKIKPILDNTEPQSMKHALNFAKKEQLQAAKQQTIDYENQVLLNKLIKIKSFDSTRIFRPFLARSTFQYSPGVYVDPASGSKCVDHLNVTAGLSPRSIHSPAHRPSSAPATRASASYLHIIDQNSKLLRAIETTTSVYGVESMQRDAMVHARHSRRLSNYRGPEAARYIPTATSSSHRPGVLEGNVRPYTAPGALQPKTQMYSPMQRPPISISHQNEWAELGVVEECDLDGYDEEAEQAAAAAAAASQQQESAAGSSLVRNSSTGSRQAATTRPMSAAMQRVGSQGSAHVQPAPPVDRQQSSRPESARSHTASIRSSHSRVAVADTSPYLQPVSRQQSARFSGVNQHVNRSASLRRSSESHTGASPVAELSRSSSRVAAAPPATQPNMQIADAAHDLNEDGTIDGMADAGVKQEASDSRVEQHGSEQDENADDEVAGADEQEDEGEEDEGEEKETLAESANNDGDDNEEKEDAVVDADDADEQEDDGVADEVADASRQDSSSGEQEQLEGSADNEDDEVEQLQDSNDNDNEEQDAEGSSEQEDEQQDEDEDPAAGSEAAEEDEQQANGSLDDIPQYVPGLDSDDGGQEDAQSDV